MTTKRLAIIEITVLTICLTLGYWFDDVASARGYFLLIPSVILVATSCVLAVVRRSKWLFALSLFQVIVLFFIELQSRYIINYFYHISYALIMLFSFRRLAMRAYVALAVAATVLSANKFVYLLNVQFSIGNLSESIFLIIIQLLIGVTLYVYKQVDAVNRQRQQLYAELLATHRQLKASTDQLAELAAIGERQAIARDIHDTLGHDLMGILMSLKLLQPSLSDAQQVTVDDIKSQVRHSIGRVRSVVSTLRDHTTYDQTAIVHLVDGFTARTGIAVDCQFVLEKPLSKQSYQTLYPIIQEALTNVQKYAEATRVAITIAKDPLQHVHFDIIDNGKGAAQTTGGYGLVGMTERIAALGGTLTFSNHNGFTIEGDFNDG